MQRLNSARHRRAYAWIVSTFFLVSLVWCPLAPAAPVGVAVLGDSLSDEYRDAEFFPPGAHRTVARNYVEILAATNHVNFGALSTDWGDIRQLGYEYNWAQDGDRSA